MTSLRSKRENWGFLDIGEVKIPAIKQELDMYHSEWLLDTTRQAEYETHEHTFMFPIKQFDYMHDLGQPAICEKRNSLATQAATDELESILSLLERAVDGKAIRVEFISMKPKSRIRTHKDRSDVLYVARRFHIPIKTNDLVTFTSGSEVRHLKPGHAYELNNITYHSVRNDSEEHRIHLIVDVLPVEYTKNVRFE